MKLNTLVQIFYRTGTNASDMQVEVFKAVDDPTLCKVARYRLVKGK